MNYYFLLFLFTLKKIFIGTATDVAGEVLGVGSDVKNFKAGDKVVAVISHSVRTHSYSFGYIFPSINNLYAILLSFLS